MPESPFAISHLPFPTTSRSLDFAVGDLVEQRVDAIIAPVGDSNVTTSRVQLALRRAAGFELVAEYEARVASLPGGRLGPLESVVTGAHRLPARYVVHVRPVLADAAPKNAEELLETCFQDAFETCRLLGASSIAAPAIGTGSYGYRVSSVARVAVRAAIAAQRRDGGPERIRFILAGPATLEAFLHAASIESARAKGTPL